MPDLEPRNVVEKVFNGIYGALEAPAVWMRSIVERNQKNYPWYHERFRRVPTVDECYENDRVCIFEADQQYKRDRMVDSEILSILRQRFQDCVMYEAPDHVEKCQGLLDQYSEAETNWFTKYGDLGAHHNVRKAFMKQKHRMVWERRYGSVGSGMNTDNAE